MVIRDRLTGSVWWIAVLAGGATFGLLAGVDPSLALGVAAAGVLLAVILASLPAGLCVLVFVGALQNIATGGLVSAAKIVGLLVALAWAARSITDVADRDTARMPNGLKVSVALLMTLAVVSSAWAADLGNWTEAAQSWVLDLALFPIAFAVLRERRHVVWLFGAFLAGAVVATGIGMVSAPSPTVGDRIAGAGLNPNELGAMAATAAVLGITLVMVLRGSALGRAAALGGVGLCLIGLVLSASRGSLLGFAVALLMAPVILGPGRRGVALAAAATAAVTIVVYLAAFAPASTVHRIVYSDASGSGRTDIWTVGLRVAEANPVLGVGAGNFSNNTIAYLLRPGVIQNSVYIVDKPKVAHNIYLQVLAELGAVGFVLFAAILGWSLACAARAARAFAGWGDTAGELLARGLMLTLVGLLAADFFSSELFSKQLWLLLATGPALLAISRRREHA